MANAANITLVGRLGGDPTTKYLPSGTMTVSFSVAVSSRRGEQESTAWYRVSAFSRLAETLDKLTQQGALVKGREVYVAGRLEPREYKAHSGETRTSLDVSADTVQLIGPRDVADNTVADSATFGDSVPF
jgi:single-strand DNA-binding protein